jgi:hypothetical protein
MAAWGRRHTRPSKELSVRAELLENGGAPLWNAFMDELRHLHLGAPRPARSVFGELQAAYEKAVTRRARQVVGTLTTSPMPCFPLTDPSADA